MALHGGVIPYAATFFVFTDYCARRCVWRALMGLPVDVRLHPRQHRPRRGRAHAPAGRAPRHAARDARLHRAPARPTPPRRSQAWRLALEPERRPGGPGAHAPEAAHHRPRRGTRRRRRAPAAPTCSPSAGEGEPPADPHRQRLRGARSPSRPTSACGEGVALARREHAVAGRCSSPRTRRIARGAAAGRRGPAGSSRPRATFGWRDVVGDPAHIGLDHFGASAPAADLFEAFGFTADHVYRVARELLGE